MFPESGDLCPICNWDEACPPGLGYEWMPPPILLFHHGRACCFGPVPCIVSLFSSPSSTWLPFYPCFIPETCSVLAGYLDHMATVFFFFFLGARLVYNVSTHSLSVSFELNHMILQLWRRELLRGQVVEAEGADGKLDNPRLAKRSLLED